jgi:hypothetical protein
MRTVLVFDLVTIDALQCKDPFSIDTATQPKETVRTTVLTRKRRVTGRMTIDATRMHKNLIHFKESYSRLGVVSYRRVSGAIFHLCPNTDNNGARAQRKQENCRKQNGWPK